VAKTTIKKPGKKSEKVLRTLKLTDLNKNSKG
jgi:hypothetical protein